MSAPIVVEVEFGTISALDQRRHGTTPAIQGGLKEVQAQLL